MVKGIILQKQSSDPIEAIDPNAYGLWASSTGDLVFKRGADPEQNISTAVGDTAPRILTSTVENQSFSTIEKGTPVRIDSSGQLQTIDITNDNALRLFGLSNEQIIHTASGEIATHGRLEDVTLTAVFGDILYVKPDGSLIGSSEFSVGDYPSVGNDGYLVGDHIMKCGVVAKNVANGAKKRYNYKYPNNGTIVIMPAPVEERQRKIDINSLPEEEANLLSAQLSKLIGDKINESITDLNNVLSVYNLSIKMMYDLTEIGGRPAWESADWYVNQITTFFPDMEFVKKKTPRKRKSPVKSTTSKAPSKKLPIRTPARRMVK